MSVKETVQAGNKVIHSVSVEVGDVTSIEVTKLITDLIDTMRHENLVGMAAPQIGSNIRIFVTGIFGCTTHGS
jgi:peptide deformylase